MVVGVDVVHGFAERCGCDGSSLCRDAMAAVGAQLRSMRCEVELGSCDVLHERATALDVHQLEATADAQHGQLAPPRLAQQRELEGISYLPIGRRLIRTLLELGAVERRVEVRATGQDEPVQTL